MADSPVNKRPIGLTVAVIVLLIEGLLMVFFAGRMVIDVVVGAAKSVPTALALAALALIPGLWLGLAARALRAGKRWARNAGVFWQTVLLSVASASFTGRFANAFIGVTLIVVAVLVLVLLFTKPVMRATLPREK